MIDEGAIIEDSLLMVGETTSYNDNTTEIYAIAARLLKNILSSLSYDETFLFNAVEFTLTKVSNSENKFNIPSDFLNLVASTEKVMLIGEFFICEEESVTILYCRRLSSSNLPSYITEYLKATLCYKIALTNSSYNDKIAYFEETKRKEAAVLVNSQYYDVEKWVTWE